MPLYTPSLAITSWSLVNQTGTPIGSGATWTHSGNVANVDVTGLGNYTELMVTARAITLDATAFRALYVSTNNGSTFYTTSGDYVNTPNTGIEAAQNAAASESASSTTAKTIFLHIPNLQVPGPKFCYSPAFDRIFVADLTNNIDAIRLAPTTGNITGGSLYVYCR